MNKGISHSLHQLLEAHSAVVRSRDGLGAGHKELMIDLVRKKRAFDKELDTYIDAKIDNARSRYRGLG